MNYFANDYEQLYPELLSSKIEVSTLKEVFKDYLNRGVPSYGTWFYLVQEYTSEPSLGKSLKEFMLKKLNEGKVKYAFQHGYDHGISYIASVSNPRELKELMNQSPIEGQSNTSRKLHELSPALVGLDILIKSTKQFQKKVETKNIEDPFGIYDANLDEMNISDDINFGLKLKDIDPSKGLYLINEKLPSLGARVDPLADLAIHALSLKSVQYLLDSYSHGPCCFLCKPPKDIGNIRIVNVANMVELEADIKGHPWFGSIAPEGRTVEMLLPIEG